MAELSILLFLLFIILMLFNILISCKLLRFKFIVVLIINISKSFKKIESITIGLY